MTPLLKHGDKGESVAVLQRALIAAGHPIAADGDFGDKTEAALLAYQQQRGLVADGIYGPATAAAIAHVSTKGYLKEADIRYAAELLQVEPAAVKAVVQVESAGTGYLKDGRVKILFERHIFYKELVKAKGKAFAESMAAEAPHVCHPQPGGYRGGVAEYPRLARAMGIDKTAGMAAASWGLFQIMGFNHQAAGFDSVDEFVDAMKQSEGQQLQAFARFVKANKAMHAALQKKDWEKFAGLYNGPAYKRHNYDSKLANAYARYAAKAEPAVEK
ncbi:MAG: N-acetylmuramidase family protein [Eikenella corrodens]|uniref:N-acetylmuramidase family protein n=1 Tax=Eikenella corrodens TaxID=539 RepID=UPI002910E8E9|nr:N-acetylmuramidase family protein [Eikenella corrodens]MDU4300256.1 N-acetylmuramidase family protein [Eikenella corrodens]